MVLNILDILETYHNKKQYADFKFMNLITDIIVKYYDLDEYIKHYSIISDYNGPNNRYSFIYKSLEYNLARVDNPSNFNDLRDNYYGFFNLQALKSILHELEHVHQEQIKDIDYNSIIGKILLLGDSNTFIDNIYIDTPYLKEQIIKLKRLKYQIYYNHNYRKVPCERLAIAYSCIDMMNIIKEDFIKNSGYYEKFANINNDDLNDVLLSNYKLKGNQTNSPTLDYLKKLIIKNRLFIKKDYSLHNFDIPSIDRLIYGLELTKEEFENINEINKELIKKHNLI